eukprot:TRINITY_DN1253_c1_g1_i4.p1 TRINITY_DN1253_c1_g1~~TRINITY_DN1253_c1_g1_i4.p1  ORF type:complete len:186 (-),score=26.63 TRINITY_DN1253_c1_g1_i4:118-675(-)
MNNIVCCSLPLLRVPAEQFREVLGCVLHTVLFSRIVSSMAPTEGYIEALDFVFSKTADPAVDRKVEAAVKACEVRKDKPSVVSLFFLEPQLKQSQWGLGFSMRKPAYFEKWEISLQAVDAQLTGASATLRSRPAKTHHRWRRVVRGHLAQRAARGAAEGHRPRGHEQVAPARVHAGRLQRGGLPV